MRKNTDARTRIKGLYATYEIKGVNLDRLINHAKKRGIVLYDVKKTSPKRLLVTVNFNQSQNFFAIAKKMCYNIKKVRYKGWGYPFFFLIKSVGLLVGLALFFSLSILFDDLIIGINFSGSGAIYKRQVAEYLRANGVYEYARFSKIDLKTLEDKTLAENGHLSFVSLKKSGNTLLVELALSTEDVKRLNGNIEELRSDVIGEVESIKVYRGEAKVSPGDAVGVGDLLVDGKIIVGEQEIKTNVLCSVSLIVGVERHYFFGEDNFEQKAVALLEGELSGKEIISSEVIKKEQKDGYLYVVNIKYRRVLCVG